MTDRPPPPPGRDWRDLRRDDRWARREFQGDASWGAGGSWIVGLILIALGVIFLAQNFGYGLAGNWWALLILLPAFACFAGAWSMYQRNGGNLTPPVTSAAVAGIFLAALALILFRGVELARFWPIILIVLGLAALFSGGRWRSNRPPPAV
jgi:hypothetical protein